MNLAVGTACAKVWRCETAVVCWAGTHGSGDLGYTWREVAGAEGGLDLDLGGGDFSALRRCRV